jgi:hypothetical protein
MGVLHSKKEKPMHEFVGGSQVSLMLAHLLKWRLARGLKRKPKMARLRRRGSSVDSSRRKNQRVGHISGLVILRKQLSHSNNFELHYSRIGRESTLALDCLRPQVASELHFFDTGKYDKLNGMYVALPYHQRKLMSQPIRTLMWFLR